MSVPITRSERAALSALAITVMLAVTKFIVWLTTGSLAVLSQTLDSALDIVALTLVFLGVRIAAKPADYEHHYGHGKAENLAAFTQTLILGAIVIAILVESLLRLFEGGTVIDVPVYALVLFVVSAIVDVIRVRLLLTTARRESSDALRAGALNFAGDIGTAIVTLISLVLTRYGIERADAVGGLLVGIVVAVAAFQLGKRSVDVLMDRAPGVGAEAIQAAASGAQGVRETRRVRLRSSGNRLFADITVAAGRTASLERAHDIAESVEQEVERVSPGADVVVHVEPVSETSGLIERVQAASSRVEGVSEVHNVLVHAFAEDGRPKLHVTLHAKTDSHTSLEVAHDLSDGVEAAVMEELRGRGWEDVRVDSHIEPMEGTSLGRDVTATRVDIVNEVRSLAEAEPDIIDCHDILVTSVKGELSVVAHVRGRGDLPLSRIHDASERIEDSIHSSHPEVGPVVIHFEPA
jgi:cation diffusion facilitator family transporter